MTFVASATASSSRSDDDAMSVASRRRSDKEIDAVPPPPIGLTGVVGDLCVARRRRCPCIAFSSLLDLTSQPHQQMAWYAWDETLGIDGLRRNTCQKMGVVCEEELESDKALIG